MIKTLNQSQFIDEMTFSKDSSYNNCFSYEGIIALFNYLEQLEEETGEPIECDPIAFCCEYTEEKSISHIAEQYEECNNMTEGEARTWLEDRTTLIEFEGGVIYQNF